MNSNIMYEPAPPSVSMCVFLSWTPTSGDYTRREGEPGRYCKGGLTLCRHMGPTLKRVECDLCAHQSDSMSDSLSQPSRFKLGSFMLLSFSFAAAPMLPLYLRSSSCRWDLLYSAYSEVAGSKRVQHCRIDNKIMTGKWEV